MINYEYELWKTEITDYCNALAELFAAELLTNHKDVSLGWLGTTLIAQSLKVKQLILSESCNEIKQQTHDFLDDLSRNELLPTAIRHLAQCTEDGRRHQLTGQDSCDEMNKISELAAALEKRLHQRVPLKEIDVAVAWLTIGVAALLVHWNEPIDTAKSAIMQYIDRLDLDNLSQQGNK